MVKGFSMLLMDGAATYNAVVETQAISEAMHKRYLEQKHQKEADSSQMREKF